MLVVFPFVHCGDNDDDDDDDDAFVAVVITVSFLVLCTCFCCYTCMPGSNITIDYFACADDIDDAADAIGHDSFVIADSSIYCCM